MLLEEPLIVVGFSKIRIDELFRIVSITILVTILAMLAGTLALFSTCRDWGSVEMSAGLTSSMEAQFAYAAIGSGPLSIRSAQGSKRLARLVQEIVIVGRNTRPEVPIHAATIQLGLKYSGQQVVVQNGSVVFLTEPSQEQEGLTFSQDRSSLWVKPILLDRGAVLLELCREKQTLLGEEVAEEKDEFVFRGLPYPQKESEELYVKGVKEAKLWGVDVLFQQYGGEEYQALKSKYKIELCDTLGPYFCYVSAGDYLSFTEGRWQCVSLEQVAPQHPVAWVRAASAKGVEIDVWDETGFYPVTLRLELQHPPRLRADALFSSVRLRTSSQVTCMFGKRRLVMKEGDWLIRTHVGWRNLKRREEIEDYLSHKLRGDLFIFDELERQQGKTILKGHLFDEWRIQSLPVSIPVVGERKEKKRTSREHVR